MVVSQIQQFVKQTGDQIVVDFVDGRFVVENKSFVVGKPEALRIKGVGDTFDLALENFFDAWSQLKKTITVCEEMKNFDWYQYSSYST